MTQETQEKQIPKTIAADVNNESYSKGFDDAFESCRKPPNQYLGHTSQYWIDFAIGWGPLAVFLLVYLLIFKKARGRQDTSIATQQKTYEEFQKIAKSLAIIAEKMDKK